jgi:hypothetical protein
MPRKRAPQTEKPAKPWNGGPVIKIGVGRLNTDAYIKGTGIIRDGRQYDLPLRRPLNTQKDD